MGYYRILKRFYRATVPLSIRRATSDRRNGLYRIFYPIKRLLQRHARHDEIYDATYFEETIKPLIQKSAPRMAESIRDVLQPTTVTDIGCGSGELLQSLRAIGISGVGFEHSHAALDIARAKGLEVTDLDLEQPLDKLNICRADLVISTEVAEHLPEPCAETYVEYLCRTADTVLITAAPPGQGGTDHVNEQPNEYWIEKFAARGFSYLRELTQKMRRDWEAAGIVNFYAKNLMIFRKPSR
jgi:SAM-dependent methyltransferase